MTDWYEWQGEDLMLNCRLQPKASSDDFVGILGNALKIRITAPPVDGKANDHLIRFLADAFAVKRQQVLIEKGTHGRSKRIRVQTPTKIPAKLNIKAP